MASKQAVSADKTSKYRINDLPLMARSTTFSFLITFQMVNMIQIPPFLSSTLLLTLKFLHSTHSPQHKVWLGTKLMKLYMQLKF